MPMPVSTKCEVHAQNHSILDSRHEFPLNRSEQEQLIQNTVQQSHRISLGQSQTLGIRLLPQNGRFEKNSIHAPSSVYPRNTELDCSKMLISKDSYYFPTESRPWILSDGAQKDGL